MKETISKEKARQIFNENAVLFGVSDGIPIDTAKKLLGSAAVDFAEKANNRGNLANGYGIGVYTAMYLTERGFYLAVTYHNVSCIRAREG